MQRSQSEDHGTDEVNNFARVGMAHVLTHITDLKRCESTDSGRKEIDLG
jgi:hypothetical protein